MVTRALEAVVLVDFAEETFGAVRTRAVERVDLVVTSTAVVARTVGAVVDVELTLGALEARQTVASVMTALVVARCAVSGGRKEGESMKKASPTDREIHRHAFRDARTHLENGREKERRAQRVKSTYFS